MTDSTPFSRRIFELLAGLAALAIILASAISLRPGSAESARPREGVIERSRYVFGWNGLPAAFAEFTLSRRFQDGRAIFHFDGSARTTEAVDLIWRMRDSVVALVDDGTFVPRRFQLFRRENKQKIDLTVDHDIEEGKFRIQRFKRGKLHKGSLPSQGVYDPVSAMLLIRRKGLAPGEAQTIKVLEGKRIYEIALRVLGREPVRLSGKPVRALKLSADYRSLDGSRSSADDGLRYVHIWVSDDPEHQILRLEVQAPLGVISGERVG